MSLRFYCPDPPREGCFRLPADEARHLVRVCRKSVGDRVELFDGSGFATAARIIETGKDRVLLVAEGPPIAEASSSCSLVLATAIPKGERFDWLVEKATELGVERLIPLVTERSVVDPRLTKLERLRRTIIEASKQARRNRLMVLEPARTLARAGRVVRPGRFASSRFPTACRRPRWPCLAGTDDRSWRSGPREASRRAEETQASAAGWHPIQLNNNVLRIETAAIAGTAAIMAICREHESDERN